MKKVEMFCFGCDLQRLQDAVNDFTKDHNVIDIKMSAYNAGTVAMIIYEEEDENNV